MEPENYSNPTPEARMRKFGAMCCICKRGMDFGLDPEGFAINQVGFDPCALVIHTNAFRPYEDQKQQQFYCHMECFRKVIDDDSIMYILEADYSTHGDAKRENEQDVDAENSTP